MEFKTNKTFLFQKEYRKIKKKDKDKQFRMIMKHDQHIQRVNPKKVKSLQLNVDIFNI